MPCDRDHSDLLPISREEGSNVRGAGELLEEEDTLREIVLDLKIGENVGLPREEKDVVVTHIERGWLNQIKGVSQRQSGENKVEASTRGR